MSLETEKKIYSESDDVSEPGKEICPTRGIIPFGKAVTTAVKNTIQEILVMLLELIALIVLPCIFLLTSPKCLTRYFLAL